MADVIHDPVTDWCACEPGGIDRCDYRLLADSVGEKLNPHDSDDAEVAACISAIERAAAYIEGQPCECTEGDDDEACERCQALGQWHGRWLS